MISVLLLACSDPPPPRPDNVPKGAAFLRYAGNQLMLDDAELGPWKGLAQEPTDRPYAPLTDALSSRLTKEVGTWIALPGNAQWGELRRASHTVLEAQAGPIYIGALATDLAFGPLNNRSNAVAMPTCPEGPVPVVGVDARLTLELQSDDSESWIRASMRFRPVVRRPGGEPVPTDFLPETCWQAGSCSMLGPNTQSCLQGRLKPELPNRIAVGGEIGCLAPLYKGESTADAFKTAIPESLQSLGLDPSTEVMVMADDNVELEVVFATLEGLAAAGIKNPQLGMLRMGSADGAPVCNAPVRNAAQLDAAKAAWFGAQLVKASNREKDGTEDE